mmetsp:Transcript_16148/g.29377  ORF Transcript_16148/g.29377 Transcript_16148/m.29377 type:complete len:206 (-) Transcript_16148:366-983(-)|eukprot:CAMPEP_0198281594 /NCGR_PEP_ID=MMETSP1449-20131203/1513_1 /TAXON_ID=420275 /ORGANISM="Attheya septentrionalis, Strain CCMP2084" /LENGTH=205 /DNA_ID=CAMNT_0043977441 /DNA_START=86 /DNA_END=703 /DNA_ORIENTATION=+
MSMIRWARRLLILCTIIQYSLGNPCLTETDLDLDSCELFDLPIPGLVDICSRIGIDAYEHVFPYLFEDGEGEEKDSKAVNTTGIERSHADHVLAAEECLSIELEMNHMQEENPDELDALERSVLAEDPELLAGLVEDVLEKNPQLVQDLEDELRQEEPELWEAIIADHEDHKSLANMPDVLASLISAMLTEEARNEMLDESEHEF